MIINKLLLQTLLQTIRDEVRENCQILQGLSGKKTTLNTALSTGIQCHEEVPDYGLIIANPRDEGLFTIYESIGH